MSADRIITGELTPLIKLTDAGGYTRHGELGETLWMPGETITVEWGGGLCASGCLHAYRTPRLAVFMDPAHADLLSGGGRLWAALGNVRADDCTKVGCDVLMIWHETEAPALSTAVRARVAIGCGLLAMEGIDAAWTTKWRSWARRWLSGEDRSADAAWASEARAAAAWAAARAAMASARAAAAWAAEAAATRGNKPFDLNAIILDAIKQEEALHAR